MPAPLEGDVGTWARADDGDEEPGVAGRRRYTTSKLLNAATAAAIARERPDVHVTTFDPGLMLGTGLSRQYPAAVRRLTTVLAPALAIVIPFASTPKASGQALARLLLEVPAPAASGAYVDHRLRTQPASAQARDAGFQAEVLRDSRRASAGVAGRMLPRALPRPEAPAMEWPSLTRKALLCRAFRCAEEDSNLHPLSVDQALNLARRVSNTSRSCRSVQIVQPRGRYGRIRRSGCCHGCCHDAPGWGPGGRRFKSCLPDYEKALETRPLAYPSRARLGRGGDQSGNNS